MKNMYKSVRSEALARIVPTKEEMEYVFARTGGFLKRLNSGLRDAKGIVGGSMAKGTWLRGQYDVDIFVQFPYKYAKRSDELSEILEERIKKKFKLVRLHGSRDYFQVQDGQVTYEIIPILKIARAGQAKNITDISPLHAKWVKKNAKNLDDIRLVKAFAKAQGVYGAESYLMGFSGYVIEILTAHYGSFGRVVSEAAKWRPKTIIDMEKHHKNIMFEVNKSKLVSPLILIDPVQAGRNTAASLNLEKYLKFVSACQAFLKSPSVEFFVKKPTTKELIEKKAGKDKVLFLSVTPVKGKEDVVGGKLLKAFAYFRNKLIEHEFGVVDSGWEFDRKNKAVFWFILSTARLPSEREWQGPPLKTRVHVEAFKKKYKKTYPKGNRIYATIGRTYTTAEGMVKKEARNNYLRDKLREVKVA